MPCDRDRSRMAETAAPFTIARRWNDFLECPQGTAQSTALARAKSFNASPKSIEINQITPETLIENASLYGNFSAPM